MLLIDDLILAPGKFLFWVLRQVNDAAQKEMDQEADHIRDELSQLHRLLESGGITEQAFDACEAKFLDRLDELNARAEAGQEPSSSDDDA